MSHEDSIPAEDHFRRIDALSAKQFAAEVTAGYQAAEGILTRQQVAVLRLIAEGLTYAETGEVLSISESTAKNYLSNPSGRGVYQRLGVDNAFSAVAWCLRHGVIQPAWIMPENYGSLLDGLTASEKEILEYSAILQTSRARAIGRSVSLSVATVNGYFVSICKKIHAFNPTHAASMHMAFLLSGPQPNSSRS